MPVEQECIHPWIKISPPEIMHYAVSSGVMLCKEAVAKVYKFLQVGHCIISDFTIAFL